VIADRCACRHQCVTTPFDCGGDDDDDDGNCWSKANMNKHFHAPTTQLQADATWCSLSIVTGEYVGL